MEAFGTRGALPKPYSLACGYSSSYRTSFGTFFTRDIRKQRPDVLDCSLHRGIWTTASPKPGMRDGDLSML